MSGRLSVAIRICWADPVCLVPLTEGFDALVSVSIDRIPETQQFGSSTPIPIRAGSCCPYKVTLMLRLFHCPLRCAQSVSCAPSASQSVIRSQPMMDLHDLGKSYGKLLLPCDNGAVLGCRQTLPQRWPSLHTRHIRVNAICPCPTSGRLPTRRHPDAPNCLGVVRGIAYPHQIAALISKPVRKLLCVQCRSCPILKIWNRNRSFGL